MKTKREKQLEIALLKEKIERLSNKKVVFKENKETNPQISNVLKLIQTSDNSYRDPSKISVESTPKGNWRIYYDNKDTGVTLNRKVLSDKTIMDNNLEHHI